MRAVWIACGIILGLEDRAEALTTPVVFDFEDGTGGWELHGSAQRVQTQLLGGEWAIFGDGFVGNTYISMRGDFSELAGITLEQIYVGPDQPEPYFGLEILFDQPRPGGALGPLFAARAAEPGDGPHVRSFHPFRTTLPAEVVDLRIVWGRVTGPLQPSIPPFPGPFVSFVDNIVFHPIPEPRLLLALGLLGVLVLRRLRLR
jgi:hypothetical protein